MSRLKTIGPRLATVKADRLPVATGDSWRDTRKSSTARGYGYKWQQARIGFLAKHPLCRYCAGKGLVTAATVVDHIQPHKGDMKLFWDKTNWQPLCKPCHDITKAREEYASGHR